MPYWERLRLLPMLYERTNISNYRLAPASELLAEIFDHITDYFDAVVFGMTCSYLWGPGGCRIHCLVLDQYVP